MIHEIWVDCPVCGDENCEDVDFYDEHDDEHDDEMSFDLKCSQCQSLIHYDVKLDIKIECEVDKCKSIILDTTYIKDEDGDYVVPPSPRAFDVNDVSTWPVVNDPNQLKLFATNG